MRPPQRHGLLPWLRDVALASRDLAAGRRRGAEGPVVDFRCAGCGGTRGLEPFAELIPESLGYHLVECADCGLVATAPPPAREDIPGFYGAEYYGANNAKFGPLTEVFILLFRLARVRALRRAGVRRGRVLDVGCGRGLFLRVLERAGYEAWGTELSPESAAAAQAALPGRVQVGSVSEAGFPAESFAAVTAWQVFEHLPDPVEALEAIHRVLAPGGVFVLSVPNFASWQARWAGASWFHLDVPRHLFHFTPDSLTRLLEAHGFVVEEISHYSLEQNPFGLVQSGLHRLGAPYFGLYRLLRGPLDRAQRQRWRRLPGYAAHLAAFGPAAVVTTLGAALGSGATFTLVARRTDR